MYSDSVEKSGCLAGCTGDGVLGVDESLLLAVMQITHASDESFQQKKFGGAQERLVAAARFCLARLLISRR